MYDSLFLQEVKDSSGIENIITTNDDLYQSLITDQLITNPNTRDVLHYIEALWVGMAELKKNHILTERTFVRVVGHITMT